MWELRSKNEGKTDASDLYYQIIGGKMEWNDYFTFVWCLTINHIPFFISFTAENAVGFDLELNLLPRVYQSTIIIIFRIFSNANNSNDQEIIKELKDEFKNSGKFFGIFVNLHNFRSLP